MCAFHKGEWLKESELPLRQVLLTYEVKLLQAPRTKNTRFGSNQHAMCTHTSLPHVFQMYKDDRSRHEDLRHGRFSSRRARHSQDDNHHS